MTHVITGLGLGGAELTLSKLIEHATDASLQHQVIALTADGPVGDRLRRLGVPVVSLGMTPGAQTLAKLPAFASALRRSRPDLVQTWLHHSDLIGGATARLALRRPIVWNVRQVWPAAEDARSLRWTAKACSLVCRVVPTRIVSCSNIALEEHVRHGYDRSRMVVLHNGFDVAHFRPDLERRHAARAAWGVSPDGVVIGHLARWAPQKDHATWFAAARTILENVPEAHFVLAGAGVTTDNPELRRMIDSAGNEVGRRTRLLGPVDDVAAVLAGLDLAVSTSAFGEGFSNVVGEAMASGVPVVTTDVGDAALIVGDTGRVVPVRQPAAFAAACVDLLALRSEERSAHGARARERIVAEFSLARFVASYEAFYRSVVGSSCVA